MDSTSSDSDDAPTETDGTSTDSDTDGASTETPNDPASVGRLRRIGVLAYGVAAYVAFLLVTLYAVGFLGDFAVPKTINSGPDAPLATALAVNLALLGAFALQHSGMARAGFKRWWTSVVPESVERSTYVLLSSLALALLFWGWRPLSDVVWRAEEPLLRAGLLGLYALGWIVVVASTFMISHADLFGLRQAYAAFRGREPTSPEFQTRWLYRYVRHPIMLGFVVVFWATPDLTVGRLLFAAAATGYALVGIWLEERDLLDAFGGTYADYRREVPMLFPFGRRKAK